MMHLRRFTPQQILADMDEDRQRVLVKETPGDIEFLESLLDAARRQR